MGPELELRHQGHQGHTAGSIAGATRTEQLVVVAVVLQHGSVQQHAGLPDQDVDLFIRTSSFASDHELHGLANLKLEAV